MSVYTHIHTCIFIYIYTYICAFKYTYIHKRNVEINEKKWNKDRWDERTNVFFADDIKIIAERKEASAIYWKKWIMLRKNKSIEKKCIGM